MLISVKEDIKGQITSPEKVAEIMKAVLSSESQIDQDKEHSWTLGLTTKNRIKYIELVTLGLLNRNLVHPREVFRLAIMEGVRSIIFVHNHPSGDIDPSTEDVETTKKLKEAGKIIGISLLDHVIIGGDGYYSFKESYAGIF